MLLLPELPPESPPELLLELLAPSLLPLGALADADLSELPLLDEALEPVSELPPPSLAEALCEASFELAEEGAPEPPLRA